MSDLQFKNCSIFSFPKIGESYKGFLSVLEGKKNIPFEIKRVYYIYGLETQIEMRGPHAHKKTEQIFICINGKATYHLDDGENKAKIILDQPNIGIYIGPEIWHYMTDFSSNTIILVVASSYYDEEDYLRNYDDFKKYVK